MTTVPAADRRRTRRVRWLILVVPCVLFFFSYFHRIAPAVVATDLMRAFSITAASLGNLVAVYPIVFIVMALVAGSLVDTLGPRWTLTLGATAMALGAALFAAAPVFAVAWVGRLLVGLGASVVLVCVLSLAVEWFRPDEFATVSGLAVTVGNLGGLAATAPLALVVEAIGWRRSFLLIAAVTLAFAAAAALLVRDRPEDLGLPPLSPRQPGHPAPTLGEVLRGIPEVVRNPRTWPPVLATSGMASAAVTFQGLWGVPYLVQVYGLTRVEAARNVALVAFGIVVGAPLVGRLSDRWLVSRRRPFIASALVFAACWLALALPGARPPAAALPGYFFVMGLASSGSALVWSCVREVNNPGRVGILIGFINLPYGLSLAFMQWLTGAILDSRWTGATADGLRVYPEAAWHAAFGACLALAVLAVVMAVMVTETRCRNVWRG